jgi:CRP-like cAMP-binding protein
MNKVTYPAGQKIFNEGDRNNAMYIIIKGAVEITVNVNNSQSRLAKMYPGDFFGEMALFKSSPRSATAKTITPTELAVIESKQQLEMFLVKNPRFAAKMVSIMVDRLAKTNDLLIESMEMSVAQRIEFSQISESESEAEFDDLGK